MDLIVAATKDAHHRDELGTGVVVTTFHSSKGREFDTVFLGACEQAVIPSARVAVNIEEQRRLFYVGMTRAKRRLVISMARNRAKFGQKRCEPTQASQFIAEAGL
jgi:DNA helicase-2/ATP-dependent DNA helicase PcrA